MVDAVSGASGADASAIGRTRLAESFDTFLALLTAQLKNQDPLSPLDSNQFTQQIVQMTGVEQQLLTNDLLKSLVANTTNGVATAVSLIGKEVRAATTDAKLQNGKAEWIYTLPRDANDVKVEVLDSTGKVVKVLAPEENGRKAGDHKVSWDGKDANGVKMPDGIYSLRVSAKDSDYATIPTTISIEGVVTGVEQSNGDTLITVNGAPVLWNHIVTIKQAAQASPPPTEPEDEASNPPPTETAA